jgi:transposase
MATWIGIDISKDTADIGWFDGAIKKHIKVNNDDAGFQKAIDSVPIDCKFIMEATGTYYLNFALFLVEKNLHVSVENPIRIRNHIRTDLHRSKDDKSDSLSIAKFGEEKNPPAWIPVTEDAIKLQQLAGLIDLYGKQIIQETNQIHAYSRVKYMSDFVIAALKKTVKLLQVQKAKTEKEFMTLVEKSYSRELEIIKSIPGIGESTAARLITSVGDFNRFSSSRQLISYLGLSPTRKQSGTSLNRKGPISRMGGCRMRSFLYLCGISAARYNDDCRAMWLRMKAAGKPGKVIIIAIVNKLIRQAYAMVKSDSMFVNNYAKRA